jgi:XTP/dITP diphosphohydrolase
MIGKLLLGTNNASKVAHYKEYLKDLPIQIMTPKEVGIIESPEETGDTLEANAILKADYYFKKSGLPTLADDGGFEIPVLNNFPGVYSRRFAGHEMSDEEVISEIIKRMDGLADEQRHARMRAVSALRLDAEHIYTATGSIEGHVQQTPDPRRMTDFPYRSLLFIDALNKSFYDITEAEEEQLGYRKAAVEQLKRYLQ